MHKLESVLSRGIQNRQQHQLLQNQVQRFDRGVNQLWQNPSLPAHPIALALRLLYSLLQSFLNYNSFCHAQHLDSG